MSDLIVFTDETTLTEIDQALARLAIWRHEDPEAEARFNAVLSIRRERTNPK